jgi:transcriptional regulator with XRE-family HTH domain
MRGPAQPLTTTTSRRLALALREGRGPTTQEALARRMGVSTRTVMRAERGDRPPTAAFINLWLASAEIDDELRSTIRDLFRSARLEARQHATDTQGRPADSTLSAHISTQLVSDDEVATAVTEAHTLTTVMQPTPLTASTLDALEHQVLDLDAAWPQLPLSEVFRRARTLRNEVTAGLAGHPTHREQLRLVLLGGMLHAHLTEALLDLGHFTAAWAQTAAGLVLAKAADAAELQVVLHSQRSRIRYWQGSYDVAVVEAQAGAANVRPGSLAAVKLFDKLALAASRTGDTAAARHALHACERARDAANGANYLAPTSEEFCSMGAAYSLVVLGDLPAAQAHAQHAITRYEARGSSPVNLTFARLGLAKAQPDPAAAAQIGVVAIEAYLGQPRRSQMIVVAARQLDAQLRDGVPEVQDFRERLHALEASTRRVMPSV